MVGILAAYTQFNTDTGLTKSRGNGLIVKGMVVAIHTSDIHTVCHKLSTTYLPPSKSFISLAFWQRFHPMLRGNVSQGGDSARSSDYGAPDKKEIAAL